MYAGGFPCCGGSWGVWGDNRPHIGGYMRVFRAHILSGIYNPLPGYVFVLQLGVEHGEDVWRGVAGVLLPFCRDHRHGGGGYEVL